MSADDPEPASAPGAPGAPGEPGGQPARRAVALRYDRGAGGAPEVVAKGRGLVAQKILDVAREHDVPIHEDHDLVELLAACEIGSDVPVELYVAVAELLTFLWGLRGPGGPD